ncbi:MAG TPA: tetratricopeptide repeat protein, partial [bacterium]|nr:tetratricopeptide repeat protein [bacterium]
VEAYRHLGYEYYQAGNIGGSIQQWETVRRLDPNSPDAYRNLGYLYMQNQPDYAAQMFQQYLTLVPNAPDRTTVEQFLNGRRH